jgi:hypothetical protein
VQSVEPGALEVGTNRRRAAATGKKEVEAVDSLRPNGQCVLGLQCVGLNGWCAALGICRIWAFSGPTTGSKQGMTQPKTGLPRGVLHIFAAVPKTALHFHFQRSLSVASIFFLLTLCVPPPLPPSPLLHRSALSHHHPPLVPPVRWNRLKRSTTLRWPRIVYLYIRQG